MLSKGEILTKNTNNKKKINKKERKKNKKITTIKLKTKKLYKTKKDREFLCDRDA